MQMKAVKDVDACLYKTGARSPACPTPICINMARAIDAISCMCEDTKPNSTGCIHGIAGMGGCWGWCCSSDTSVAVAVHWSSKH